MTWRATARRVLPYLVVAATGFLAAYLIVAFLVFPPQLVLDDAKVPNVVGSSYDAAVESLERSGFHARRGEVRIQATVPPRTVLEQDPPGGSMEKKGTTVTLDISASDRTSDARAPAAAPTVPSVVGQDETTARVVVMNAGFTIDSIETAYSSAPVGTIIGTRPPANAIVPAAHVTLIVSGGPALVIVPPLTGQTLTQATENLRRSGLRLGDVVVDSSSVYAFPNSVLDQHPAAGEQVAGGTLVSLRIAPDRPDIRSTD